MRDPSNFDYVKQGINYIGIFFTGILGFLFRRHINTVKEIEKTYVNKESHEKAINKLEVKIDKLESRTEIGTTATHKRLDDIYKLLAEKSFHE